MLKQYIYSPFTRILLLVIIAVQLVACGGGSSSTSGIAATVTTATSQIEDDIVLAGSVGDGPVTGATIEVWSSRGRMLGTMMTDNTASFRSRIRVRRSNYPLLLKVSGGIDLVTGREPDFQMVSVMLDRYTRQVNINPFSTLIVKIAQSLPGGINANTVMAAQGMVTDKLGFGLDPGVIASPVSTPITDANIASLMKSSEAMGEMIRRTRDLIAANGRKINGDTVLAAIAADMQDGNLNGLGIDGTDPRITAVANVVAGQVLVEALANTLKVGGIIATAVIDQAILTTRPGIDASRMTQSVRITDGMLQQTLTALVAAGVLDSSTEVAGLETTVSGISAGSLPRVVANILPADSSRSLDNAVLLSSTADVTQLAAVNATGEQTGNEDRTTAGPVTTDPVTSDPVTTGPGTSDPVTTDPVTSDPVTTGPVTTVPVNHAPAISGSPARSVTAGTAYNFQPVASDADGDPLTFTITGKPAWAGFNTATGRLSGTPGDTVTRTYSNIAIAVTDKTDTTTLPAFSITVDPAQATAGSFSLTWTAPVARADGSPLSLSEIGGYRIHYGTSAGSHPNTVDVSDGSAQAATVSNLTTGTYHVVMTSYDSNGLESANSAEITKVAR